MQMRERQEARAEELALTPPTTSLGFQVPHTRNSEVGVKIVKGPLGYSILASYLYPHTTLSDCQFGGKRANPHLI